jgi:hypothetical protein
MRLLLSLLAATLTIAMPEGPAMAQSARYVLTSVGQNIDVEDWQITARDTGVAPTSRGPCGDSGCTVASRMASI